MEITSTATSAKEIGRFTSFQTKAFARHFMEINAREDFGELVNFLQHHRLPVVVLGNGTNMLLSREYYDDRLFIKLGRNLASFNIAEKDGLVSVGAAAPMVKTGTQLIKMGYADFLFMCLIPGCIGGGVRQNAGTTHEGEIKDVLHHVEVFDLLDGKFKTFDKEQLAFGYRDSMIQHHPNFLVTEATFKLRHPSKDIEALKTLLRQKQNARRAKQPQGKNCGSTFKRPEGPYEAWWYIDQVSLRGAHRGGARISTKHCNWIINENNAHPQDILYLITEIEQRVKDTFGLQLEREVVCI
jgi:UDP-N-acetylmuramate dehydrogenase